MATLHLRADVKYGGAGYMPARALFTPRQCVRPRVDRGAHQVMPRGMEGDFIDALPGPVKGMQHGRYRVGIEAPLDRLFAACHPSKRGSLLHHPPGPFALHALNQRGVLLKNVIIDQWRNLIKHLVSSMTMSGLYIK